MPPAEVLSLAGLPTGGLLALLSLEVALLVSLLVLGPSGWDGGHDLIAVILLLVLL